MNDICYTHMSLYAPKPHCAMNIRLTQHQRQVADVIEALTRQGERLFLKGGAPGDLIFSASYYAHALYMDLLRRGQHLRFSPTMRANRGVPPTDRRFFESVHALQDLVRMLIRAEDESVDVGDTDSCRLTRQR